LGKAREAGRRAACLSNTRQMAIVMTFYANENKAWYPVIPSGLPGAPVDRQWNRGGVASLFSLEQYGPDEEGPFGYRLNPNTGAGGYAGGGGNRPLLAAYLESFEILTCPSDKIDYYPGNLWWNGTSFDAVAGTFDSSGQQLQ